MEDQKQHHEDEMKALKDQLKAARNLPIAQLNGDNKSAHAQISKVFLFAYFVLHVHVDMWSICMHACMYVCDGCVRMWRMCIHAYDPCVYA